MIGLSEARELAAEWIVNPSNPEMVKLAAGRDLRDIDWSEVLAEIEILKEWILSSHSPFKAKEAYGELEMLAEFANSQKNYHSTFCGVYREADPSDYHAEDRLCDCKEAR